MERITFELENSKDLKLFIAIAEKMGIKKFVYPAQQKIKKNEKQNLFNIIDAGVDISKFGDIKQWQKNTRADRDLIHIH